MKAILIILATLAGACAATAAEEAPLEEACKETGLPPAVVGAIVAGALGGGYMYGRKHKIEVEPQPLAVEMKKEFVGRDEFDSYRRSNGDELRHLHGRIDNLTPVVSEIKGNVQRIANTQDTILKLLLKNNE